MSDGGEQMFHSLLFRVVNVHVLFQPGLALQVQAEDSGGTGISGSHDIICLCSVRNTETKVRLSLVHSSSTRYLKEHDPHWV